MRETLLTYPPQLFRDWKRGRVHRAWYWEHEGLFDKQDLANCDNQHKDGYHFAEWFTAVHFWKRGFRVLVTKYARKSHSRKYKEAERVLGRRSLQLLVRRLKQVSPPDLLVFDPVHRFFFFTEVKRDKDRLQAKQRQFFHEIEKKVGCQVLLVNLKSASS